MVQDREGIGINDYPKLFGLIEPQLELQLVLSPMFGSEAALPLDVQLPSLRVVMQFTDLDENTQVRLVEMEALDEHRLMAQQRLEIYQAQMAGAFNKRVKFCSFGIGDLLLTIMRSSVIN